MRKTFELWGINLLTLYSNWERSAYDELMEYKRKVVLATQRKDIDLDAYLRDLAREHEKLKIQQEQKWELRVREILGEEKLKTTRVTKEIEREKMKGIADIDMQRMSFDEKLRQERAQWELESQQDQIELQRALSAKAQLDALKIKRFQEMELAQQKLEQNFKTRQMAMQTGATERIMEQAIKEGVADSDALKEMMRQQTMQKMADREVEKVRALSEAERARYDLEIYKEAEDRDRKQQLDMMDASARIMEAGKQNVPQTLVQGASSTPITTPIAVQAEAPKKEELKCPNCSKPIQHGWKLCPSCGNPI